MTDEELFNKYPKLLRQYKLKPNETCLCWGLIPGPGWTNIVADMCKELDAYREKRASNLELTQIKEKFGELRVYSDGGDDMVDNIIRKYEVLSRITCMGCGNPGMMRKTGWMRCHCDICEDKYLKREK